MLTHKSSLGGKNGNSGNVDEEVGGGGDTVPVIAVDAAVPVVAAVSGEGSTGNGSWTALNIGA